MKFCTLLMPVAALLLITGCVRIRVANKQAAPYPFSEIATYQWIDAADDILAQEDTLLDRSLQQAINNELAARGWKEVRQSSNATVQVTYYLSLSRGQVISDTGPDHEREFSGGMIFDRAEQAWSFEEQIPDQVVYEVETCTAHVLLYDTGSGTCIWHETAETEIDRSVTPEKLDALYQEIARKLIHELPR